MKRNLLLIFTILSALIISACAEDITQLDDIKQPNEVSPITGIEITYADISEDATNSDAPTITATENHLLTSANFDWTITGGDTQLADINSNTGLITVRDPQTTIAGTLKVTAKFNNSYTTGTFDKDIVVDVKIERGVLNAVVDPTEPKWNGSLTTAVTEESTVFEINKPSELAWIALPNTLTDNGNFATKTVKLMKDIDMDNKSFAGIAKFAGVLDGNGYRIYNLKLEDTVNNPDGMALIQKIEAGKNVTIKNLRLINGTVNSAISTAMFGASFIADVAGGDVTLSNVSSNLIIHATTYAGGFIGKIANSKSIIIEKSMNKGAVTCSESNAGGLIGMASSTDTNFTITIDNSSNEGNVVSGTNSSYIPADGGGLIGTIKQVNTVNIINSFNKGDITVSDSNSGGFIGSIDSYAKLLKIEKSYNKGKIVNKSQYGSTGGFIGGNNNTEKTTIANSFNSGDVEGHYGVGGLVGATFFPEITSSYNSGKITVKSHVDGPGDNSFAGGLIGSVWSHNSTTYPFQTGVIIANSYNVGVIESYSGTLLNSYSGGLIGKASTLYGANPLLITVTSSYSYTDMIAVTESGSIPVTTPILGLKEEKTSPPIAVTITPTDNFYYSTTPLTNSDHATVKTDVEFQNKTTFSSWDFVNTWEIVEGAKYPTLKNVVKLKK